MSEVIISNDIEDYVDCKNVILRNSSGFPLGTIVDVEEHIIAYHNRRRIVFVLDDGRKVFADITRLAKRKTILSAPMVKSRIDSASLSSVLSHSPSDATYAIGKSYYRGGSYAGTIISRSVDDFGPFVMLSTGIKVRIHVDESDEFIAVDNDEFFTDN